MQVIFFHFSLYDPIQVQQNPDLLFSLAEFVDDIIIAISFTYSYFRAFHFAPLKYISRKPPRNWYGMGVIWFFQIFEDLLPTKIISQVYYVQ